MPTRTIESTTDADRLAPEQAIAFVADLRRLADTAPHGTVPDAGEALAVGDGRTLLRDSLAAAVPARADAADAQTRAAGPRAAAPATCRPPSDTSASPARTAPPRAGTARSRPTGFSGWTAASPARPKRMAAFASARDSFARANAAPTERAGWTLDRESLRPRTRSTARRLSAARPDRNDAARFARAGGVIEVAVDAGQVNAVGGGRDVTVAVVCKRPLGQPASADGWANRQLPAPTVRAVVANIEDSAAFAGRVRAETDRLDATTAADVTVLADGAEWIWNPAGDVLPQAAGVLDFFHVAEHVADAVNAIWPAGEPADELFAGGRAAVLTGGKAGLERWIGAAFGALGIGGELTSRLLGSDGDAPLG